MHDYYFAFNKLCSILYIRYYLNSSFCITIDINSIGALAEPRFRHVNQSYYINYWRVNNYFNLSNLKFINISIDENPKWKNMIRKSKISNRSWNLMRRTRWNYSVIGLMNQKAWFSQDEKQKTECAIGFPWNRQQIF